MGSNLGAVSVFESVREHPITVGEKMNKGEHW
jgi:hypothetical protein